MLTAVLVGFAVGWFIRWRLRRAGFDPGFSPAQSLYLAASLVCAMMTYYSIRHEVATGVWSASIERTLSDDRVWAATNGTVLWMVLLLVCVAGTAQGRRGGCG